MSRVDADGRECPGRSKELEAKIQAIWGPLGVYYHINTTIAGCCQHGGDRVPVRGNYRRSAKTERHSKTVRVQIDRKDLSSSHQFGCQSRTNAKGAFGQNRNRVTQRDAGILSCCESGGGDIREKEHRLIRKIGRNGGEV